MGELVEVPRDTNLSQAPSWGPHKDTTLWLKCGNGHIGAVHLRSEGHEVSDEGVVTPSVVCPRPGCTWHEHVILEDYP